MLFELGWVDDADAVGRRAGELCAFVVPLGAGGGGLDTGAGAYDACRGAPTPESFDRCENEKVGTPPLVPPAPGRPTGADADADAARASATDDEAIASSSARLPLGATRDRTGGSRG